MVSSSTRALCAACGALLLAIAAVLIRTRGIDLTALLPALGGFAMLAPAAMVAREGMSEAMRRARSSALVCFTFATFLFTCSMSIRRGAPYAAQQVASLGVAFWAVSMLLAFGAAWFWSRARRSV
jgi:uncharacterized membrane protein (GlpM family)